ncbi:MAG: bifunctional adenosylcobinamide kinase/adenosylcobinamide-phosphate guanylyltransferase [Bacteroidales bacterium]|nr:bifunctional adenosylcobinamide kinase/adenosylcobinamide-phosphate guanylyltransferase [Bacteroidales bacterium]
MLDGDVLNSLGLLDPEESRSGKSKVCRKVLIVSVGNYSHNAEQTDSRFQARFHRHRDRRGRSRRNLEVFSAEVQQGSFAVLDYSADIAYLHFV